MAFQTIRIKNSNVAGKVPVPNDIDVAELCVNLKDHTLFSKDADGNIFELVGGGIGIGDTPPSIDNEIGDLWWDGNNLLIWNGASWEQVAPVTSVNGETGDVILDLGDLGDVTTGGANEGDILILQGGTWVPADPGSLAADVDLGYTAAISGGIVTNTAGDDASLPLVDDTNAGLMPPDLFTKVDNLPDTVPTPNDGELTIEDSTGSVLGTFSADQAGDDTITLPAGFSGDYDDLANKPTIPSAPNDGILTVKNNDGSANTTFSADQAGPSELILPKGFSGDYSDLSGKPTIGDGQITINQGGTEKASFTVNQAGPTIVNLDAGGGGSSGLQGAESPLSVNGNNVRLEYAKGLHVVSNKLEAWLGDGLTFEGDKIKVDFPDEVVAVYKPSAGNVPASSEGQQKWGGGGTDDLPDKRSFNLSAASQANGFISLIVWRWSMQPNEDVDYGPIGTFAINRCQPTLECNVTGRGVRCITSGDNNNVALRAAGTISFNGGGGADNQNWDYRTYETRIDEWEINSGSTESIKFEFGVRECVHNKTKLIYNAGCRVAMIPFQRR